MATSAQVNRLSPSPRVPVVKSGVSIKQIAVPHSEAAIANMGAALGLPEVMPQLASIARVHGPGVVRHREIQGAIDFEHGGLDGASAGGELPCALAPNDDVPTA